MVEATFILTQIDEMINNVSAQTILIEILLLLSFIGVVFFYYKLNNVKRLTVQEEAEKINNYVPEPLVGDVPIDHPALSPRTVTGRVGKRIVINGNDCLNLSSQNYLGLLENDEILNDSIASLRKYGVGSCGPRGFYGTVDVHLELEERLAKFMGMEEAVVYSYGFSTIASAIPAYSKRNDVIFADEKVNFAIQKGIDASRSTVYYFKHNDMKDLERILIEQELRNSKNPKKAARTRCFLVAEGIYMNTGEICPLPELVALRQKYRLRLFLDESVSFGVLGKTGHGLTEHFNVNLKEIDLISAGMEWAVGSIGGFCVGSHFIVEHQRLSGLGYCFSASLPPLLTQAAISALDKFENEPNMFKELQEITKKLHAKLKTLSHMVVAGNELSPVKHLYFKIEQNSVAEKKLLSQIVDMCLENELAVINAEYLDDMEKCPPRQSLRIISNRLLTDKDINEAVHTLEVVTSKILV